jgi:hypothetical protein
MLQYARASADVAAVLRVRCFRCFQFSLFA